MVQKSLCESASMCLNTCRWWRVAVVQPLLSGQSHLHNPQPVCWTPHVTSSNCGATDDGSSRLPLLHRHPGQASSAETSRERGVSPIAMLNICIIAYVWRCSFWIGSLNKQANGLPSRDGYMYGPYFLPVRFLFFFRCNLLAEDVLATRIRRTE